MCPGRRGLSNWRPHARFCILSKSAALCSARRPCATKIWVAPQQSLGFVINQIGVEIIRAGTRHSARQDGTRTCRGTAASHCCPPAPIQRKGVPPPVVICQPTGIDNDQHRLLSQMGRLCTCVPNFGSLRDGMHVQWTGPPAAKNNNDYRPRK